MIMLGLGGNSDDSSEKKMRGRANKNQGCFSIQRELKRRDAGGSRGDEDELGSL